MCRLRHMLFMLCSHRSPIVACVAWRFYWVETRATLRLLARALTPTEPPASQATGSQGSTYCLDSYANSPFSTPDENVLL